MCMSTYLDKMGEKLRHISVNENGGCRTINDGKQEVSAKGSHIVSVLVSSETCSSNVTFSVLEVMMPRSTTRPR